MNRKNYKQIIFIFFIINIIMIISPNRVFAAEWQRVYDGTETFRLTGGSVEDEIQNINIAKYKDGENLDGRTNVGGSYYVRYDISKLLIKKLDDGNNYLQLEGWGLIKDFNNGKKGVYAPIYYLKLYDDEDENNNIIYKYTPKNDNNFTSLSVEGSGVNASGASEIGTDAGKCGEGYHVDYDYREDYDNIVFAFDNINLNPLIENAVHNAQSISMKMMIVIPDNGTCTNVRTDWFDISYYDFNNTKIKSESSDIKIAYQSRDNYKSNEATVIASQVLSLCDDYNECGINQRFIINDGRKKSASIYEYKFEANGKWYPAYWLSANHGSKLTINVEENNCLKSPSSMSDDEKQMCCSNSNFKNNNMNVCCEYIAQNDNANISDSDRKACCDNSFISNADNKRRVCCAGEYAYSYVSRPGNKYACCNEVPETCCSNRDFVNNNWNLFRQTGASIACCSRTDEKSTYSYYNEPYYFDTFKTAGLFDIFEQKCSNPYQGNNSQACTAEHNKYNKSSETVYFTYNGIDRIEGTKQITIPTDVQLSNINTNSEISYQILSSNQNNLNISNINISDVKILSTSNKRVTIQFKYSFQQNNLISQQYDFTIEFGICYNSNGGGNIGDCNDNNYKKYHEAICNDLTTNDCDDKEAGSCSKKNNSASCNRNTSSFTQDNVYTLSHLDYGKIVCNEAIELSDYKSTNSIGTVYSGTGFEYPITVKDTITCEYIFNKPSETLYTYYSQSDAVNDRDGAIDTIKANLNEAINEAGFASINYNNISSSIKFISNGQVLNYTYDSPIVEGQVNVIGPSNGAMFRAKWITYSNNGKKSNTHYTRYKRAPKTISNTTTYRVKLPVQYINRLKDEITTENKSNNSNYINGGNKFYTSITDKTAFLNFTIKFDNAGLSGNVNNSNFYCQYATKNILTTGGDIDLDNGVTPTTPNTNDNYLTRPISLSKPFNTAPSNSGRATNWAKINNNINYEEAYITDSSTEIYTKPMYEFTLTPGNINDIQKYNKNHSGYNSWNLSDDYFTKENVNSDTGYTSYRTSKFISCLLNDDQSCNEIGASSLKSIDAEFNRGQNNARNINNRFDKTGDWN